MARNPSKKIERPGQTGTSETKSDLFRLIVESIGDALYTLDKSGCFTFVNEAMPVRSGFPREWLIGRNCLDIVQPQDRERVQSNLEAVLEGASVPGYELMYQGSSGQTVWAEINAVPLLDKGNVVGALVISRDITERKEAEIHERTKAEEAVRSSETYYKMIFENTGTAMIIMEDDTTISLANAECKKFVGYAPEHLQRGRKALEFVSKRDLETVLENKQLRVADPDRPPRSYEFEIVDRYGKAKVVLMTIAIIPNSRQLIASFIDVTERKKMEAALKESEEKYRHIFETVMEGIFQMTPNGAFVDANPAVARIFGYKSSQHMMRSVKDIMYEVFADAEKAAQLKRSMETKGFVRDFEIQCRRSDGERIWISTSMRAAKGNDGKDLLYEGTLVDISERKKIQEDLERKSRSLEETNAALRVLLRRREEDKTELEEKVIHNMKELVLPYVERLKTSRGSDGVIVDILEANINDVLSPFARSMAAKYAEFTPKEIQIADLMKKGKTTKEISQILNLSPRTIDIHRYNIRKKLNINNKKINLRSYLLTLT